MRSRIILLALFVLCLGFASFIFAQSFETIEIGKGAGAPKWSPDGTKLAFMAEGWLCVADADGKGLIQKITNKVNPYIFDWMSDSDFVVKELEWPKGASKRARIERIKTVALDGKVEQVVKDMPSERGVPNISGPFILRDGTVGYYEGSAALPEKDKVFKIIKKGKQNLEDAEKQWKVDFFQGEPSSQISLRTMDGKQEKKIPNPKGYDCLQLSPDGSKILALNAHGPDYGIFVLDLDGNELSYLGGGLEDTVELKPGISGRIEGCTVKWSPDSKRIVGMFYAQDEWNVIATDLVVMNVDGIGRTRLTNTPDEIEANPSWSPDGTKIAYVRSGRIFIIKLE